MFDRLNELTSKFDELTDLTGNPDVIADHSRWRTLMKELSDITPIVLAHQEYVKVCGQIDQAKTILEEESDEEMRQLAKDELKQCTDDLAGITDELKRLLLPTDPNDEKNVIVEIRGGAGGDEAALFAQVMYRMYGRYAERRRWKTEIMSLNESGIGGFKEVVFMIMGRGAYSRLKYESGVHRVQRIPVTESSGRIHTSTVTVAVLPEAEDVEVEIDPADIRTEIYRSSGNGGQSVNTTDSAVRLTHLPSGITVACQDEKSQLKNKNKAMKILRSRLLDAECERQKSAESAQRRSQIGTGDRSERIRTYNYPQGRVTDHRIALSLHNLEAVLDGELDVILDTCITHDQAKKLA